MTKLLCILSLLCFYSWQIAVMAGPIANIQKRSPQTVDDAVIARVLSFEPRTSAELEQFRVLTHLLKLLIERRTRLLERASASSEERATRVKNELVRLRRYNASLNEVMKKFGVSEQQLQQRDHGQVSSGSSNDGSVSKNLVNGINQPLWLLEQLRKVEQQRRRSRGENLGQVE